MIGNNPPFLYFLSPLWYNICVRVNLPDRVAVTTRSPLTEGDAYMRLTNTQRNEFWDHVMAIQDLSSCQLKLIIFIYNNTFECDKNDVYINLAAWGRAYGYDKSYLYRQVMGLIDYCVIEAKRKFYHLNIDYRIWVMDKEILKTVKTLHRNSIHKQLARKKRWEKRGL